MYELPPSHPRYQLVGTQKEDDDIKILIYDHDTDEHTFYYQSQIKHIKDKELMEFLFSVRRYINEERYDIGEITDQH
jgi:hypothetical protein